MKGREYKYTFPSPRSRKQSQLRWRSTERAERAEGQRIETAKVEKLSRHADKRIIAHSDSQRLSIAFAQLDTTSLTVT